MSIKLNRTGFKTKYTILLIFPILFFSHFCKKGNVGYRVLRNPEVVTDKWGVRRNYRLFIPESDKKIPLLVYFHGVMSDKFKKMPVLKNYTGSPVEETGLISFCRTHKIALLVPEPAYTFKFLDVKASGWSPFKKETDGIEKMIKKVLGKFKVMEGRIYLAGISAGAVFSHYLANRHPSQYRAILSHSQGYISEDNRLLSPSSNNPKFGVVFCYTIGDYKNLKEICKKSFNIYKKAGYKAVLLKDLPPKSHKWANSYNRKFWKLLKRTGGNK